MDKFVSRGGVKLQAAIENWKLSIENLICLDVGSSTGGFVDCLLQNGAAKVYSVDTAYGELAWTLRNNLKVVVMERTNILYLQSLPVIPAQAGIQKSHGSPIGSGMTDEAEEKVDLITIDASWTKLELILPVVQKFLKSDGQIIALLKPHYQAAKKDLVKGILPKEIAEQVKDEVIERVKGIGFRVEGVTESPILGGGGNTEYLLRLTFK